MGVSLNKGNSVSLKKADGSDLSRVTLGLGWDPVKKGFFGSGGSIDLDASALLFSQSGAVESVYYGKLTSSDGAVQHTGDNLTGAGDGDDEQIMVDLSQVREDVHAIVFTINSYSGHTFDKVENVFARVIDASSGQDVEVVRYNLAEAQKRTANIIAKLTRSGNGWQFTAVGEYADGKTVSQLEGPARNLV